MEVKPLEVLIKEIIDIPYSSSWNKEWINNIYELYNKPFNSNMLYNTTPDPTFVYDMLLDMDDAVDYLEKVRIFKESEAMTLFKFDSFEGGVFQLNDDLNGPGFAFSDRGNGFVTMWIYCGSDPDNELGMEGNQYEFACPCTLGDFIKCADLAGIPLTWNERGRNLLQDCRPVLN